MYGALHENIVTRTYSSALKLEFELQCNIILYKYRPLSPKCRNSCVYKYFNFYLKRQLNWLIYHGHAVDINKVVNWNAQSLSPLLHIIAFVYLAEMVAKERFT